MVHGLKKLKLKIGNYYFYYYKFTQIAPIAISLKNQWGARINLGKKKSEIKKTEL